MKLCEMFMVVCVFLLELQNAWGAEYAIAVPMGLWYRNKAAVAPCDNRGFAGGDMHSIMNNPPPLQHTVHIHSFTPMYTYIQGQKRTGVSFSSYIISHTR